MYILFRTKKKTGGELNFNYRGEYHFDTFDEAKNYEARSRRIDKLYKFEKKFDYNITRMGAASKKKKQSIKKKIK